MCPTGTSEIWAGELVCASITDALRERSGNNAFCIPAPHPQPQCKRQEMKQGLVAILMPLSVLASPLSKENVLQKCILNQVRADSVAHLNLVQALPRETAGRWDSKRSLRGPGATPNERRVLCSHITIIISLNVYQPAILTYNICSLDCYFLGFFCGSDVRKTKPHFTQQMHKKLHELNNTSPPALQILQL